MKIVSLLLALALYLPAQAQWKWFNPSTVGYPVIQGQGFTSETGNAFVRLPDRAKDKVRADVWNLSRNSAGLAIHFYSDAPQLRVRYGVSGSFSMPHMPATGVSGIDLYTINSDGIWQRSPAGQYSFGDTVQYTFGPFSKDKYHNKGYEYRLYLPLYNTVKWLEVGTPENSSIEFIPKRKEKPIVIYGTSIAQGACASRAGMAWTNIVARSLDQPLINLGFSGNGRLEPEVIDFICETDARLFVLDCLPNLSNRNETELTKLITNAVHQIRKSRTAPILLVEHASGCNFYGTPEAIKCNETSRKVYDTLLASGVKNLYYLSCPEINLQGDALVDNIHPNDLGMQREADAYETAIRKILNEPVGSLQTTCPVTQRREPNNYEWQKRHREVLSLNETNHPKAIIIGNSITHFWGGLPTSSIQSGKESWNKYMQPAGFNNLGYGYDRIENVLWRIYHGELDGYQAEKIVLMIGTNNLYTDSENDIVEGLRFLLSAIKTRQPKADIKVMGILPRRDGEKKVITINKMIRQMVKHEGYRFVDASAPLLQKDGKINEKLFRDGLHPNEDGYMKIAGIIAE